ncbi:hypothetical protein DRO69_13915 [Candidatus Bathyarchaeota archaeon]|nr:MAG: hypothetical protein DRO69_13915 [Candidatus Bathyarchaeota archaeon]
MGYNWRGRGGGWRGPWPGRGPFSYLPPWQRPGWLYGRGACWWLLAPYLQTPIPQTSTTVPPTVPATPFMPTLTKDQEKQMLEQQVADLESQLSAIRKRLSELRK